MGIFSIMKGICDKCGKMTIWDGPFSDCGCYEPAGPKEDPFPIELPEGIVDEHTKVTTNIHKGLDKKILRRKFKESFFLVRSIIKRTGE